MFLTKCKAEKLVIQGRKELIKDFKDWQCQWLEKEKQVEAKFDPKGLKSIHINIWDDFDYEDGITSAKIESMDIPCSYELQLLSLIVSKLGANNMLIEQGLSVTLKYNDDSILFPELLLKDSFYMWRKFWSLEIKGVTSESKLETLTKLVKSTMSDFEGTPITVSCES
ncbi:MAG: hypothetical protein HAW67_04435 [Endozoicomonadaceae bacterium]|nr:hypothetical protein [Endozoicomonadaceae bacterium]